MSRVFEIAPGLSRWVARWRRVIRWLGDDPTSADESLSEEIDEGLDDVKAGTAVSRERLRYLLTLSIVRDVARAGGDITVADSRVYVRWPDWSGEMGRAAVASALAKRASDKSVASVAASTVESLFLDPMPEDRLRSLAERSTFHLRPANTTAALETGATYLNAFNFAIQYWNMPYRGREGRRRKFVIALRPPESRSEYVVGIIEVGDDAPFATVRDDFLCLTGDALSDWMTTPGRAKRAAQLFQGLRESLGPIEGVPNDAAHALAEYDALHAAAGGRSRGGANLIRKKRLTYLLRLAQGEEAARAVIDGRQPDRRHIREGARAVHDLFVPRLHLEATVCGALPPFSRILGGKLVVAFLAHPDIRSIPLGSPGTIVSNVFTDRIVAHLPNHGLLALTTKGLYPDHAPLYNRARVPGRDPAESLRLRRIGKTAGATTTLIGEDTARFAFALASGDDASARVSTVFGTGGAKRQRAITSALTDAGLPGDLGHAGIRRPIYGVRFASNLDRVIWAQEQPDWLVDPTIDAKSYDERATNLWRERWLLPRSTGQDGTAASTLPSVVEALRGEGE